MGYHGSAVRAGQVVNLSYVLSHVAATVAVDSAMWVNGRRNSSFEEVLYYPDECEI